MFQYFSVNCIEMHREFPCSLIRGLPKENEIRSDHKQDDHHDRLMVSISRDVHPDFLRCFVDYDFYHGVGIPNEMRLNCDLQKVDQLFVRNISLKT